MCLYNNLEFTLIRLHRYTCKSGPVPDWVAQLNARLTGVQEVVGLQHSFVEINHEIFSVVIDSLPLIQEGQLSVSGKRMYTILVNCQ